MRAADHLSEDVECLFVLIGEGREKARLMSQRDRLRLTNLQILPGVAKRDLPAILSAADVCLMTVTPVPVLEHNSANKFFDSLSAGKPVVLNYGGWQREVLESADAGVGCTMGDEEAFLPNLAALPRRIWHDERRWGTTRGSWPWSGSIEICWPRRP